MLRLRIEEIPRSWRRILSLYVGSVEQEGEVIYRTMRHRQRVVCRGDTESWAQGHHGGKGWVWEEEVVDGPVKEELEPPRAEKIKESLLAAKELLVNPLGDKATKEVDKGPLRGRGKAKSPRGKGKSKSSGVRKHREGEKGTVVLSAKVQE